MASKYTLSASALGVSEWIQVDSTGKAGTDFMLVVDFGDDGGSALVDVEFAVEKAPLDADTRAIQHHILNNLEESLASTLHVPATGFRLNILRAGGGAVTLRIIQGKP